MACILHYSQVVKCSSCLNLYVLNVALSIAWCSTLAISLITSLIRLASGHLLSIYTASAKDYLLCNSVLFTAIFSISHTSLFYSVTFSESGKIGPKWDYYLLKFVLVVLMISKYLQIVFLSYLLLQGLVLGCCSALVILLMKSGIDPFFLIY